jgi:Amt family ammonium transporter
MKKFLFAGLLSTMLMVFGTVVRADVAADNATTAASMAAPAPATAPAVAAEPAAAPTVDTGDTAWLLISTALVLLMTLPGLAFFYGGLVRRKNVLGVLMQCAILLCVISLQWVLVGYSLSFSPGNAFIGSLKWIGLSGLAPYTDYAATIPHQLFMIFQMMFAVITPALIIGAFAERMKFSAFLLFSVLWATIVYDPMAHMVWGVGGFLRGLGALDFAGGTVVHINAGIAAIVAALYMGRRKGYDNKPTTPHNLPFTVLGAGLLWFGWFGFNAGSALGASGLAVNAFVTTNLAAAAAGLVWALLEWYFSGKPTTLGVATGAVAGLVAITPACGFVSAMPAIFIGVLVSLVCFFMVAVVKGKLGYDDSLDAFGVHGIGGMIGAVATGLFASVAVNPAGANGLFFGNFALLKAQLIAVGFTIVYSGVLTYIILKVVDVTVGVRVVEKDETVGLDLSQHHEAGYTVLE